jgi:hypothetical protein
MIPVRRPGAHSLFSYREIKAACSGGNIIATNPLGKKQESCGKCQTMGGKRLN